MLNFATRKSGRAPARGFSRRRVPTQVLEPMLTPSGLVDAGCEEGDLAVAEVPMALLESSNVLGDGDDSLAFVTALESPNADLPFTTGVFTVGETGEVSIDFLFDGGVYEGDVAIFSLEGMEDLEPGSKAFIQEAADRALSQSERGHVVISDRAQGARFSGRLGEIDFNEGEYQGVKTVQMQSGDRFGVMLAANQSIEEVAEGKTWGVRFSMATANPDDNLQFGQIGDVTGDGNTFAFEDLNISGRSDRDYNDVIFQVHGATGEAPEMDILLDQPDWRDTELGQEILAYVNDQADNPIDPVDPVDPLEPIEPIDPIDPIEPSDPPVIGLPTPINQSLLDTVPQLEQELDTLTTQLQALAPDVEISVDPELDAITEPTDENFALMERKLEEAIAQLQDDAFADVSALAGSYNFEAADQPLIGVIDTGFAKIADIDQNRILWGYDHIDGDDYPILDSSHADADHGTQVLEVIAATQNNNLGIDGVNDDAPLWLGRAVGSGKWAESLTEFVDAAKVSGQTNAVVNLSFDLANADGTPRTYFTAAERAALEYARENNVLVVAAAGNGGIAQLSALGLAAKEFSNLITVGAANGDAGRADYSSYGEGLDLMAYGARAENYDTAATLTELPGYANLSLEQQTVLQRLAASGSEATVTATTAHGQQLTLTNIVSLSDSDQTTAMAALQQLMDESLATHIDPEVVPGQAANAGTSFAAAKVTGAASQVWAANPDLTAEEVKALLKATATDLDAPGWDLNTGAGLLNLGLAVKAAQDSAQVDALDIDATTAEIATELDAAFTTERPAIFKKVKRFFKKVVKTVVKVVSPVIKVVKKVFGFVKTVGGYFSKAISFFKKAGSFLKSIFCKFVSLPVLGKLGFVLGGIGLVGGIGVGIYQAYKWYQSQKTVTQVQTSQIPSDILELDKIWALYSSQQRQDIKAVLNGGLSGNLDKYRPLLDGSDPDGILPLVNTWGSLTSSQQSALGFYVFNGLNIAWKPLFKDSGVDDPSGIVTDTQLKAAWAALTVDQRNVLLQFMTQKSVSSSSYGSPLFNGDPDGITKILAAIGDSKLTDAQRNLLVSFMLHSGGVPTEYEGRFQ
ncbi:MAG: S8 family serine peptidase [Cyanobacteria bacterium P01_G01_bin.54]